MNPAVRASLERLFECPASERTRILESLPPEIRDEVRDLLKFDSETEFTAIGSAIGHAASGFLADRGGIGNTFGRYRILRPVGEGSMGTVYEAEQDKPRRTVALKVIKAGLASPELLRRFEQESQALARLQHPGIAQIFDAGTVGTGNALQPYLAMEFIRGESLTEYAECHQLSPRQRLELVAKICDAVQHAHQRGLIHRDLKPGNIIVEESGQPRILDFGVARVTDSDTKSTRGTNVGTVIGTLAYMSPEQVKADPLELDTRSDVYSLGVILYELLSGELPYQLSPRLHEAARTICEDDPLRLSAIRRTYRGDVETMVAKALEKDKSRRYASAADLAVDIHRHLTNQPILARPASTGYHLQKFVSRHKPLVAAAVAVFVTLSAGIVVSAREARQANHARQLAIEERDRAATAERIANEQRDKATAAERRVESERDLAAAERNRAVEAEAQALKERNRAVSERQRADTASAAAKAVSEFLQNDLLAQAGASTQAGPKTKPDPNLKVRTALDRAASRIGGKFEKQPLVEASVRQTISDAYLDLGLYPEAQLHLERAVELRRGALGEDNPETLNSLGKLASLYHQQSKFAQAATLHAQVLEARRRVLGEQHPDTLKSMGNLAEAYRGESKYKEAEQLLKQTLELKQRVLGPEDPGTLTTMNNLALTYMLQRKLAQAEPLYTELVELRKRVSGEEHPLTFLSRYALSTLYWFHDKLPMAESLLNSLEIDQKRVLGEDHPDTLRTMSSLGTLYVAQRNYPKAEPLLLRIEEIMRRVLGEEHLETTGTQASLADIYMQQNQYAQAERIYTKVLEVRRRTLGEQHSQTLSSFRETGFVKLVQQKHVEAEPLIRASLDGQIKKYPNDWKRFASESMLGIALAGQGKYADAEPLLVSGYEGMVQRKATVRAQDYPSVKQTGQWIVQFYKDWGKPDRAAEWAQRIERDNALSSAVKK